MRSAPSRPRFRPAVEALEDRRVPTVTYHGGPVLANVEVEGVFLGSDWAHSPVLAPQAAQLGTFLQSLTGGSYLDLLGKAGYRVGRGSYVGSDVEPIPLDTTVSDAQIQATLAASIRDGSLPPPDANRLYFVFVEPEVDVTTAFGDSAGSVLGYHWAFQGPTGAAVPYAVIPYPVAPNAPYPGLSAFETLTKVSSHELAEAVTDPQGQEVGVSGWYDGTWRNPTSGERGGEIADITERVIVDLGGYVVQGVAGRHDQPLLPAGGTPDGRFPVPQALRHGRHQPQEPGDLRHLPGKHGRHQHGGATGSLQEPLAAPHLSR